MALPPHAQACGGFVLALWTLPGPIRSVLSWLERQDFWVSVLDAPFAYLPVCLGLVGSALSQSGLSTLVHGASCKGAFVQCAWCGVLTSREFSRVWMWGSGSIRTLVVRLGKTA